MKITYKHEIKSSETVSKEHVIDLILSNRNIKDKQAFLHPTSPVETKLADFGYTKEIKKTLQILENIRKEKKPVVVYTDYDADGITGGSILWETLHLLGFNAMPYVPHRQHEGYGFSVKGIDTIKKIFDPALIISVDHGITAREKVTYAKSLGIPIIITDHHIKPDKLPDDAEAIFHIPELSGSGVSYFFSKMIFEHFSKEGKTYNLQLTTNFKTDYLALASIGTIADLVPLVGHSRSIVKYGLQAFRFMKRVGMQHILKQAMIDNRIITPYEVGFIIAPRINAIGRLEHAIDALRLLCTTNDVRAFDLASKVGKTNQNRQDLVKEAVGEAKEMVSKIRKLPKLIVLKSDHWHEGIIGLIASKITEKYYRPTIVMTKSDGFYKGSARSIPAFHMTKFLTTLKKYLVDMGGHAQASGFTIEKKQVSKFITEAEKKAEKQLSDKDMEKVIETDLKTSVSKLSLPVARALEELNPFGIGNPNPTFYSEVELIDTKLFGKKQDHLKIFVKDLNSPSFPLELICFSGASLFSTLSRGQKINIAYSIEIDRWGGSEKLRGRLIQII